MGETLEREFRNTVWETLVPLGWKSLEICKRDLLDLGPEIHECFLSAPCFAVSIDFTGAKPFRVL